MFLDFNKSQFFVAFCALLMCLESYLIASSSPQITTLVTVFFSTLFIYNAAHIKILLGHSDAASNKSVTLSGEKQHIVICAASAIIVFGSLAAGHFLNIVIFLVTAVFSLLYMMPFKSAGKTIKGLRNNLILKNVILAFIWASATVLFPLVGTKGITYDISIGIIFLRRFFFIYALTVVYDIRDTETDTFNNMKTIAVRFGEKGARLVAIIALTFYVLLIKIDSSLNLNNANHIEIALYISAIITAMVILATHKSRKPGFYQYVVDGTMAVQFVLVFLFSYFQH